MTVKQIAKQPESETKFPSLHVAGVGKGFVWVISTWNCTAWEEITKSTMRYENWIDAHIEGAGACASWVLPPEPDADGASELPVFRLVGKAE